MKMGANSTLPSIAEVAAFLESSAPSIAKPFTGIDLGSPEAERRGDLSGPHAGREDESDPQRLSDALRIRAEVLSLALEPMVSQAKQKIDVIGMRLDKLARLRFISGAVAAISAPSSILFLVFDEKLVAIILSVASFFGSIAQLFGDSFVLGPGVKEADLLELNRVLSSSVAYGELTAGTLSAMLRANAPLEDIKALLEEGNERFGKLNGALNSVR